MLPKPPDPDSIPQLVTSAIGQADDTAIFSNDLFSLKLLASLSEEYAVRSNTIFVPEKTKLVAFTNNKLAHIPPIESVLNPISISNTTVPLSKCAEHVGIIRDSQSNFPHILNRIAAHKKANAIIKYASNASTRSTSLWASVRAE